MRIKRQEIIINIDHNPIGFLDQFDFDRRKCYGIYLEKRRKSS